VVAHNRSNGAFVPVDAGGMLRRAAVEQGGTQASRTHRAGRAAL
jgi:hypothetical protein